MIPTCSSVDITRVTSKTCTGGDAVVETLLACGIDTVFGIPGGHSLPVYDALSRCDRIRHVLGRHEQGLGFMADGFARASGRIAAVSITSGPAVANLTSSLGQATTDTVPMLVIASTPRAELVGKNRGGLHDLNNSLDLARPVSRYAAHCATIAEIPGTIANIIQSLRVRRPGGAYVQIPTDVLAAKGEVSIPDGIDSSPLEPNGDAIETAATMLRGAKRPLIIAGTGAAVSGAGNAIQALAEKLGAVVSTTVLGRGVVPGDHPNVIFPDGIVPTELDEIYASADVVVAIGTMLRQEDTSDFKLPLGDKLIHIDIDEEEFGRSYPADHTVHADARRACETLLEQLNGASPAPGSWAGEAKQKLAERVETRRRANPEDLSFIESFRETLPRDTVLFADRCNIGYWWFRYAPGYAPRTFHYPMGYGGLGGALPEALGARIACPDHKILCVLGDGGMQFTLPELAVAVQENTNVPIVVSNNNCYGAIRAGMNRNKYNSAFGTTISNPDYEKIADAYGIPYRRSENRSEFLEQVGEEVARQRLVLMEFVNDISDP